MIRDFQESRRFSSNSGKLWWSRIRDCWRPFLNHQWWCTRGHHIKDLLIRAKIPVQRRNMVSRGRKVGFKRCQRNRCKLCSYTGLAPGEVVQQVVINHSGEVIPMKSAMDCQTRNLLYILLCSKCLKQYLGETSKTADKICGPPE